MKKMYSLLGAALISTACACSVYAEAPALADHIGLAVPSKVNCDPNTASTPLGVGFNVVIYSLDTNKIAVNEECQESILLFFNDAQIAEAPLHPVGDEYFVAIQSVGAMDQNDDIPDYGSSSSLNILFSLADDEKFRQDGQYKVVIPDGAMLLDGVEMTGCEFVYNFVSVVSNDFEYTLDPSPAVTIENGPSALRTITLTFIGSDYVSYYGNGGAKPTTPDGTVLRATYPNVNFKDQLIYDFGKNKIDWSALTDGEYVFSIPKGYITVNNRNLAEDEPNGNFDGLTAYYTVKGSTASVTAIGTGEASAYTVCSLDGKTLLVNAAAEALSTLPEGIYVINGVKTCLRH